MKLLFVAPRFHTNQYFIVKTLLEQGHEVIFDVVFEGKSEDHSLLTPWRIRPAKLYSYLAGLLGRTDDQDFEMKYMLPNLRAYWSRLRMMQPDVVIVRNPTHLASVVSLVMVRLLGRHLILYTQGPKYYPPSPKKSLLISGLLRLLKAAWITPVKGDEGVSTHTHPHLYYLPFVIEADRQPKMEWFAGGAVHLLCIGKFYPRKNHLLLLEAIRSLHEHYSLRLTLLGECSNDMHRQHLETIRNYIRQHRLEDVVNIETNLPFAEVQKLYRQHDVFVLPSSREPAGVSLLEAMGKGLPVICSDSNGTRWYIEEGVNGHVFRSDDVAGLRRALERLLSNRAALVRMGHESVRLATTVHNPQTYYLRLGQILQARFGLALESPVGTPSDRGA